MAPLSLAETAREGSSHTHPRFRTQITRDPGGAVVQQSINVLSTYESICSTWEFTEGWCLRGARGEGAVKQKRLTSLGDKRLLNGTCEIPQLPTNYQAYESHRHLEWAGRVKENEGGKAVKY